MAGADTDFVALQITECMWRRRAQIVTMGKCIGLFEWALFCEMESVDVQVHMRDAALDILIRLGLSDGGGAPSYHHVAWCVFQDGQCWMSSAVHKLNHFVALLKVFDGEAIPPGADSGDDILLEEWAASRGLVVLDTVAEGNCAVDSMTQFVGLPRNLETWAKFRQKLGAHCESVCVQDKWRMAFQSSGECPVHLEEVKVSQSARRLFYRLPRATKAFRRWLPTLAHADARAVSKKGAAPGSGSPLKLTDEDRPLDLGGGAAAESTELGTAAESTDIGGSGSNVKLADECRPQDEPLVVTGDRPMELAADELALALCWTCGVSSDSAGVPCHIPMHVRVWQDAIDEESAAAVIQAYRARGAPGSVAEPHPLGGGRSNRVYKGTNLSYRIAVGKTLRVWLDTEEGKAAAARNETWHRAAEHMNMPISKRKDKKDTKGLLRRCLSLYDSSLGRHGVGRVREAPTWRSVPGSVEVPYCLRQRSKGLQGAPAKMGELSVALFQWFVDRRMLVAGRMNIKEIEQHARTLLMAMSMRRLEGGVSPQPPVINERWLSRWRHTWGVSLRKPTRRFKVKRHVLLKRLETYWSNLCVTRIFLRKVYGIEPVQEQYDQKGVHYNEAGSKRTSTYEMPFRADPPVRENHSQTRERMSWMTCTYSVLDRDPPLEMMFKAKGRNVLSALRVHGRPAPPGAGCGAPPGGGGAPQCKYTFTTSPSGSYRTEHVLDFLRQHLLTWTPERVARHDYRVLSLDAYRPHLSPDITKLAFERGYISHEGLMVPGGATGIVQGPDTDLHAWLEKELIGLQEASTSAKLSVRPGSTPSESRQSMVDYSIALWEMADHRQGVKSFKRNGLNNNLDGSEDKLITRSAREFWLELNMSSKRAICEIEVEQFLDALGREPHVGDVFQLLQPYSDDCGIGVAEEGEELQCALEAGEVDYVADDDGNHSVSSGLDDDDVPDDERPIDDLEKLTTDGVGKGEVAELPVSEGLGTGEVAELPVIRDIRIMDVLIKLAWKMDNKSTLVSLEQQRERLQRQLRKGDIIDREAAADFCAEQRLALKDIQAVAKLEDQANKLLKQSEQQKNAHCVVQETTTP